MKKIHSDVSPLLAACGLDAKASAVYQALARHPHSTIAETARRAKLYRTDVYAALPELERLGLLVRRRAGNRTAYSAAPAERLRALAQKRLGPSFASLLSDAKREMETGPIRILRGKAGLQTVLKDLTASLKSGGVFYRISSRKADTNVEQYVPSTYRAERDRKKLEQFVITNASLKAAPFKRRVECLSKAVPKDEDAFEENAAQLIYGDKIAFVDYDTETAAIIHNAVIARFQTRVFRLLFKRL